MSTIIGLKELREQTNEIITRVEKGESFTVVKRSKPVFRLSPATNDNDNIDTWLDNYIPQNIDLLKKLSDK